MSNYPFKNWMAATPDMDRLPLGEVVWPGAHNSGLDFDFPYPAYLQPAQNWFVCQDGPFIQQLNEGVRALTCVCIQMNTGWASGSFIPFMA